MAGVRNYGQQDNFCRKHETIKMSLPQTSALADKQWTILELLERVASMRLLKLAIGCLGFVLMVAIAFLAINEVQLNPRIAPAKLSEYVQEFIIATLLFGGSFLIPTGNKPQG
ncbi:MAG: hypothetical protein SH868_03655 [Bythopirellula sp.]|nr:hypothetical protein [Bythopirellula sp.]